MVSVVNMMKWAFLVKEVYRMRFNGSERKQERFLILSSLGSPFGEGKLINAKDGMLVNRLTSQEGPGSATRAGDLFATDGPQPRQLPCSTHPRPR